MKKRNPWAGLTPEQKQEKVDRMIKTRRANKKAGRQALPVEIEHITIPLPAGAHKQSNGMGDINDLAALIVAVWRKL